MPSQTEKGKRFRALHQRDHAFIIPNPWDVGSAHLLAGLGFEALASTSAGFAFSVGQRDNTVGRERMLVHAAELVAATDLPVSADLENGFADAPAEVARTVTLAAAAGLVGCSIEDSTGRADAPLYPLGAAVERIRAAAEAARALPFEFTLTARAENFLVGRPDLKDTIARLQAYQEAGADVLYAPGLASEADIAAVLGAVDRPVNVLAGSPALRLDLAALSRLGVKRVSVGSGLARAAYGAMLLASREMHESGSFAALQQAIPFKDLSALFKP